MNRGIEKMTDFAENGEKQFFPDFLRVPPRDGQDDILKLRFMRSKQEQKREQERDKANECCRRIYAECDPMFGIPDGFIYVKEDGSRCSIHDNEKQ